LRNAHRPAGLCDESNSLHHDNAVGVTIESASGGNKVSAPVEFYFDFSSPYGYLASHKIDALVSKYGCTADWRPMLLGVAFKQTGGAPLTAIPLKGDYSRRDMLRSARFHGVRDFRMPTVFPIATHAAARITLWTKARDPALAERVAKALYRGYFAEDRDISNAEVAAEIAAGAGADRALARAAIDDVAIKDALKREVDGAIARGVFGSPFVFVDGEPFWGLDRFDQIERWLATGAF
jgi:2-hydroxychromene-2-carboxylate isomerase